MLLFKKNTETISVLYICLPKINNKLIEKFQFKHLPVHKLSLNYYNSEKPYHTHSTGTTIFLLHAIIAVIVIHFSIAKPLTDVKVPHNFSYWVIVLSFVWPLVSVWFLSVKFHSCFCCMYQLNRCEQVCLCEKLYSISCSCL